MSEGESTVKGAMALTAGLIMASPLQSTINGLMQRRPVDNSEALKAHAVNARTVEANRIIKRQNATIETLQSKQERSLEVITTQAEYIDELERKLRLHTQMEEQRAERESATETAPKV
jgi:uncharacterized protein YjcR